MLSPHFSAALESGARRLRYVPDSALGIQRVKQAAGFVYRQKQRAIRAAAILKRIQSLVIPPAWMDVRICVHANGHLQATGRDARGRKQYVYHPQWRELRDRQKFGRLLEFARALPRIRRRVRRDLRGSVLNKTKVLAAVVRLLELSHIRVGNEEYARTNQSFGLTTLRDRHVRIRGEKMLFQFRGKSGKDHAVELSDAGLARAVARCQEIPGQELFQYFDDRRRRRKINSGDVNRYLRECSGGEFTAKDFRTWAGTVLMAEALAKLPPPHSQSGKQKNLNEAVRTVAARLGNTPAICRNSYIHPIIIDSYLSSPGAWTVQSGQPGRGSSRVPGLPANEAAVWHLLQCHENNVQKKAA